MDERLGDDHGTSEQSHQFRARVTVQPAHITPAITYDDRGSVAAGVTGAVRETRPGFFNTLPDTDAVSPSEAHGAYGEYLRESDPGYLPRFGGSSSASMMLNPKRAYRQRRKDPSCDACRERKVKVRLATRCLSHIIHN